MVVGRLLVHTALCSPSQLVTVSGDRVKYVSFWVIQFFITFQIVMSLHFVIFSHTLSSFLLVTLSFSPSLSLSLSFSQIHGRSREQRYTKQADWDYIGQCAQAIDPLPLFGRKLKHELIFLNNVLFHVLLCSLGNGDVLSYEEYNQHREQTGVAGIMIAR